MTDDRAVRLALDVARVTAERDELRAERLRVAKAHDRETDDLIAEIDALEAALGRVRGTVAYWRQEECSSQYSPNCATCRCADELRAALDGPR